jgi:hypothetical protein
MELALESMALTELAALMDMALELPASMELALESMALTELGYVVDHS